MIATDDLGGSVSVLFGLMILVVAGAWLIFPFIVISKCNDIIRELKKISAGTVAGKTPTPPATPSSPKGVSVALGILLVLTIVVAVILVQRNRPALRSSSGGGGFYTPTPAPIAAKAAATPAPEFVTITAPTEGRIPETFEMVALTRGRKLPFVSLEGDNVRVRFGKLEALVPVYATDLAAPK